MTANSKVVATFKKAAQVRIEARNKLTSENITDKKYSLFHRGQCVFNWDGIEFIREWMLSLGSGPGTFLHYNEPGLLAHDEVKIK